VLHVISDLHVGGAGRYLLNILPGLGQAGFEVEAACPGGGELEKELRKMDFPVHPLASSDTSFSWSTVAELYRLLTQGDYQIVHTHASLSGRVAARLAGRPKVVLTRHGLGNAEKISPWRRYINRTISTLFTDKIVAISQAVTDSLINEGVPPKQICIISNGIVVEEFERASGAAVRMELGVGNRPMVGMVARLVAEKAPQDFVRAAAIIREHRPDTMFVLVGAGPLEADLRGQLQELGLTPQFNLLGYRRDMPTVQAAIDIAVLTSHHEGQGLVLLEAMAAGKPVVATSVGGIPEVVQPEHTGLLVPPGDPAALAKAVLRLLNNTEQAQAMGRAGQKLVREQFSRAAMAQQTAELYLELLDS
jgi:glycosyltransferase involved in cell wall biosynthesis